MIGGWRGLDFRSLRAFTVQKYRKTILNLWWACEPQTHSEARTGGSQHLNAARSLLARVPFTVVPTVF